MAVSVVPALIDALVAAATAALPAVLVNDSWIISSDPGDYLMVGVSDPSDPDDSEAAIVNQSQLTFGATRPRHEEGIIRMAARSINGDADPKVARDAVYAIQEALAAALRTTDNLGVAGITMLGNAADLRLLQNQGTYGARATLLYGIAFQAVI